MERTYIIDLKSESIVKVQGYVEKIRNKKSIAFLVLKDITGKVQITVEKERLPELVSIIDELSLDSVITVVGDVVENAQVKLSGKEIIPKSIVIESVANPLPINRDDNKGNDKSRERSSIDQRMDYRWIDLRTEQNQLIFKTQTYMVSAMRNYLLDNNFLEIHTPKLIASASESGSEVFKVEYFENVAYLAQSPQFYKQMAMSAGFEKIFEIGPVFRAEKSNTSKHTTEFTGFDLLWRGVEITTGAQREHRYEILKAQADEKGLGEDVSFYLEFFKYGCPPHGGFGIGIDRLTMLLLGLQIKEAMFLFRGPNRLTP